MLQLSILCMGKLKEPYWRQACGEYEKRLQRFCKLQLVELSPVHLPEQPAAAQVTQALEEEARAMRAKLPAGSRVIALCIEGQQHSSAQLGTALEAAAMQTGKLAVLIGSSHGLAASLKQQADLRLSMSAMTFPHQLARVMLLEQLYRGFCITQGHKYHK